MEISRIRRITSWYEKPDRVWGLPDTKWWLKKLPWTSLSMLPLLDYSESCWNSLTKSSCRLLVLKWKMMMELFQNFFKCMDSHYMLYRMCLKCKIKTSTSGFQVWKFWLKTCTNGVLWRKLTLGLFLDDLKFQTTSKWCLEDIGSLSLLRICKAWNLQNSPS